MGNCTRSQKATGPSARKTPFLFLRVAPKNAAILFALVKEHGLGNTKVVLRGEAPPMIAFWGAPATSG